MTVDDAQAIACGAIDAAGELVLAGKHMDAQRVLDGANAALLAALQCMCMSDPGCHEMLLYIGRLSGAGAAYLNVWVVNYPT